MAKTTIKLANRQNIRSSAWSNTCIAECFTVEGFARENGEDVAELVAQERRLGRDLVSSIQLGASLLGDRRAAEKQNAELRARWNSAQVLATGDLVEIEGRLYLVKFNSRQENCEFPTVSDPIAFVPFTP